MSMNASYTMLNQWNPHNAAKNHTISRIVIARFRM